MIIRKVSIRNFRNLREVDVQPHNSQLVIVGENDTGKSNFLLALRLLFDRQADGLRLNLSEDDINCLARQEGQYWFSVTVEIGDLQNHKEIAVCFKERLSGDEGDIFVTIEGKYQRDDEGEYGWDVFVLSPDERHNSAIPFSRRMQQAVPLYYLDTIRDASRDTRATGRSPLAEILERLDFSDIQNEVRQNLQQANVALARGKDIASLADSLTSQLTPHVKGGRSQVTVAIADEETPTLIKGIRLHIRKSESAPSYDLSRHGTGLQNLVLMALFRHKIVLEERSGPILEIEEPEAHLHPHAQRQLFKDLCEINTPVFITTHSQALIERANPLSICRLHSFSAYETVCYQLNPESFDKENQKDLAKLMRGGRADLFFANSLIVVEGQSELIAVPAFAEALGYELDREGVSVVEMAGNDCAFIVRACKPDQFGIPVVVVYDSDALNNDNKLVDQAYKSGLISETTRNLCRPKTPTVPERRKMVLNNVGWIGAEACFEEEVCQHGYLETVLSTIDDLGETGALERFLSNSGLQKDAKGTSSFIKKRNTLKVPVARAVADSVNNVGCVPPCYQVGIETAIALANPEIVCLIPRHKKKS